VLSGTGMPPDRAALVAEKFAENQRDGIYSHGLNRFPGLLEAIKHGRIDVHASPEKIGGLGALEQWDGKRGIGLWNAHVAMNRALELAREHGIGCIGLRNTNHWMRGGAYGLQAAESGCMGVCWTNTTPLMPPWGSAQPKIGNNPLVIAIPRDAGHLLLDMAMSQYSNGKLEVARTQGKELPLPGGYDQNGKLTCSPGAILSARRALPIGYWKGSALAVMLDAAATLLSGGSSTSEIGKNAVEQGVSQVFVAINAVALTGHAHWNELAERIIADLHTAAPAEGGGAVRYPGESMLRIRRESMEQGVLVDEAQFEALRSGANAGRA
jgi:3-dehydro-L-gulonate 2-dehydrogenase